jgi:adenosylcobinamide kinase / adenosylcobinamide-phosphate guanylyltransferase
VLYAVTGPGGDRLLYATDTGQIAEDALAALAAPFDAVLLDETFGDKPDHGTGHLDLAMLPTVLASLRGCGAITAATTVVATHLSHHNPPTRELRPRLAALGVQVLDDLGVVLTGADAQRPRRRSLVLGGARSGKSRFAEEQASAGLTVTYVATGGTRPDDPDWVERVARHQRRRPAHWVTVETTDVRGALAAAGDRSTVLVDCLALWLTAQLDELDAWSRTEAGAGEAVRDEAVARIQALVSAVEACPADVIVVSNEVGMGVVPATTSGRLFRDLLGILNVEVALACDHTTLVVAGIPMTLPTRPHRSTHG